MHIRTANPEDFLSLKKLYQEVAQKPGGIARNEEEITDDYLNNFLSKSLADGLIIVAEHPEEPGKLIAEIHAYRVGIKIFNHVLSNLTIVVHPAFQGKKLGRTIFTIFLEEIAHHHQDIGKVELIVCESNKRAIELYQSLGFRIEGRLEMRIKTMDGMYEADIPMGWQNPTYEF